MRTHCRQRRPEMRRVLWSWNRPRRARKRDKSSSDCGYWTHRKMKSSHLRNNQHHHCCIVAFVWPTDSVSLVSETLTISEGGLSRMPLTCKLRQATYREETQQRKPPLKNPSQTKQTQINNSITQQELPRNTIKAEKNQYSKP